jgi:hypothetical protein
MSKADVLANLVSAGGILADGAITPAKISALHTDGGTMNGAITFANTQTWPTFNQSTTGNAATANKWTTARTLSLGGDATGNVSIDGSADATLTVAVADDSHNHTSSSGNFSVGGNLSVTGNLTINGTTTTINSTVTTIDDPIITLGGDTAPASDDNKDRGIEFRWHNGSAAKTGFFGFDDSTGYMMFIPDATNTSEVFSGTLGDIQATNFRGALFGNANTATTLATARTINGVSFNGSADITVADSTKLPLAGGTLTGASTVSVATWQKWILETTGVTAKARQGSDSNGLNFTTNALWNGSWVEDDSTKKKFAYIQHLGNGRHEFRTAATGAGVSWVTSLTADEAAVNSLVALQQGGNQVLHAANYNSYALPLGGGTMTGAISFAAGQTWPTFNQNTTGSAASAPLLSALNNYVWSQSTLPTSYSSGIQCAFVGPAAGEGAWQNYGSVMTMRTYSGGGGSLQLYTPYGPGNGGTGLQVRFGNYSVSSGNSWTSWKTLLASDNYSAYSTFSGLVVSGGNTGFRNDAYSTGVRNPIWCFANATSYGLSYFQGSSGLGGIDTIGIHPNGDASASGGTLAVTSSYTQSIGSLRAPIFYDSNNTSYYLDPAGVSNINNLLTQTAVSNNVNGLRNISPGGGSYVTGSSTVSGAIRITLPQSSYPMLRFTVRVYTYDGLSFDIYCGGHTSGGTWHNTFAYMITQHRPALNVRFTYGGGNLYVYIGDLGSSWAYPQVFITDVQVGYTNYEYDRWDDGWAIAFDASTYNNVSSTHVVYPSTSSSNNSNPAYASIYYDANNTGFYVDPTSTSNLVHLITRNHNFTGVGGDSGASAEGYSIYQEPGAWSHPYPDLVIGYHTGSKIGGYYGYNGTRFYNNNPANGSLIASIGDGDNAMRSYDNIIAYASDKRLKENIEVIPNALNKVLALNGVTFDWKPIVKDLGFEPSKVHEAGVLAQEVQAVLPEAVDIAPFDYDWKQPNKSKSGESYLTVNYEKLVPLLIEAIKEQQKQIDELKKNMEKSQ